MQHSGFISWKFPTGRALARVLVSGCEVMLKRRRQTKKNKNWLGRGADIAVNSGAGATREDQCVTAVWLQGRTRKQQIAVARARPIRFCFAPLSFQQLPSHPLSQVARPLIQAPIRFIYRPARSCVATPRCPVPGSRRRLGVRVGEGETSGKLSCRRENEV